MDEAPRACQFTVHTVTTHRDRAAADHCVSRVTHIQMGTDGVATMTVRTGDGDFICEGSGFMSDLPDWLRPVVSAIYGLALMPAPALAAGD